jgi:hypothetical protein
VLPWQWFVLQLQGFGHRSEIFCFLFVFSLFVIGLCVFVISLGYFVFAEARCNRYLCDINIFPLSKKCTNGILERSSSNIFRYGIPFPGDCLKNRNNYVLSEMRCLS